MWQFNQSLGSITLTLNIHAKNGDIIKQAVADFNGGIIGDAASGWDAITADRGGWGNRSWDESLIDFSMFSSPSDKEVDQKIRKNTAYISFSVRSNTRDTYYELSHLSLLFTYIGVGIEFLSQKGRTKV